jgi:hypothetical protein
MTQNRNDFGMTPTQIGILAALAGAACLLFGLGGWFVLRGNANPFTRAPQSTPVPLSTSIPFVMPTLAPTKTPTAVPYEMLIPDGWVQFKTGLVEIWLPAEFKQADPGVFQDSADARRITARGRPDHPCQMLVMVSYEPLTADSLDVYLEGEIAKLPSTIRVAEKRSVFVNSTEVVRFVFETRSDNNIDINDMAYVFLDGSTVWYVEYVAQINEFYEMLSTFEQSVKTFRIVGIPTLSTVTKYQCSLHLLRVSRVSTPPGTAAQNH